MTATPSDPLDRIESRLAEVAEHLAAISKPPSAKQKDLWDKLGAISGAISSVVLGAIGLYFTHQYNARESTKEALLREQQIRQHDVEIVEKFVPYLTGSDTTRQVALIAISALGSPTISPALAQLFRTRGSSQALLTIAARAPDSVGRAAAQTALATTNIYLTVPPDTAGGSVVGRAALVVAIGELRAGAREIGGTNAGPWVKKYTRGKEGPPWAAAFVSWCFSQASGQPPFAYTLSDNAILAQARERGWLQDPKDGYRPVPGDIMLLMRTPRDAVHSGIVHSAASDYFTSIEGNTNDTGEREGYMVAGRVRGYSDKLFVHIP